MFDISRYEFFLNEEHDRNLEEFFDAAEEIIKETTETNLILQEYFSTLLTEDGGGAGAPPEGGPRSMYNGNDRETNKILKQIADRLDPAMLKDLSFSPIAGSTNVTKVSNLKFPQNLFLFISQLIEFIKKIISKLFQYIGNAIKGLTGRSKDIKAVTWDDVHLKDVVQKSRNIVSYSMPVAFGGKIDDKTGKLKKPGAVELITLKANDVAKIDTIFTEEARAPELYAIKIDIERDLFDLQQYLQHFIDLFENAYGSNNEHLFGITDLEMLLDIFSQTLRDIETGRVATIDIAGSLAETNSIDSKKIKDDLIRTKINTDKLKEVYVKTSEKINDILRVIQHKQILGSTGMGISFRFLSQGSYTVILNIIDVLKPRLEHTIKMEKEMEKIKVRYEKLVNDLAKLRTKFRAVGNVAYTSIVQRKVDDLFVSSRMLSQSITLRLTTIGIYIKELREIQIALINVNAINSDGTSRGKADRRYVNKLIKDIK